MAHKWSCTHTDSLAGQSSGPDVASIATGTISVVGCIAVAAAGTATAKYIDVRLNICCSPHAYVSRRLPACIITALSCWGADGDWALHLLGDLHCCDWRLRRKQAGRIQIIDVTYIGAREPHELVAHLGGFRLCNVLLSSATAATVLARNRWARPVARHQVLYRSL